MGCKERWSSDLLLNILIIRNEDGYHILHTWNIIKAVS